MMRLDAPLNRRKSAMLQIRIATLLILQGCEEARARLAVHERVLARRNQCRVKNPGLWSWRADSPAAPLRLHRYRNRETDYLLTAPVHLARCPQTMKR